MCLSVKSHLTSRMSNRAINERAYSVACERQKICGDLPETTAFKSYAAKHEFTGLPAVSLFRSTHSEAPEVTQRVSTTFSLTQKLLARVGVRTDSTTHTHSHDARRGQFSAHAHWHSTYAPSTVCAEGLHFSVFHSYTNCRWNLCSSPMRFIFRLQTANNIESEQNMKENDCC